MNNSAETPTTPNPVLRSDRTYHWLSVAGILFIALVLTGVTLVMLLNTGYVNHILTPVLQYTSLFTILWDENAWGATKFLANKSLLAFAYKDPRSGLNLWTYEIDTITTLIYIAITLLAARIMTRMPRGNIFSATSVLGLTGMSLTALSVSYMTSIAHCSGPTWVGFVGLYGLGFDEFELYPAWQIACAAIGIALLGGALYRAHVPATNRQ